MNHDQYLFRELEDRRTRIFGIRLLEWAYTFLTPTELRNLQYHTLNPDISKPFWNLLTQARKTAEEWAGYFVSEYDEFIHAQLAMLQSVSLRGLWTRLQRGPIRQPKKLILLLRVCIGPYAGIRYQQYSHKQNNNAPVSHSDMNKYHNQLLEYLAKRWHKTPENMLLQTYRSNLFPKEWIQQHPLFKKLVQQGLAHDLLIGKEQEIALCQPHLSTSRLQYPELQNFPSQRNSNVRLSKLSLLARISFHE